MPCIGCSAYNPILRVIWAFSLDAAQPGRHGEEFQTLALKGPSTQKMLSWLWKFLLLFELSVNETSSKSKDISNYNYHLTSSICYLMWMFILLVLYTLLYVEGVHTKKQKHKYMRKYANEHDKVCRWYEHMAFMH